MPQNQTGANIGLQRTARLRLAAAEAGSFAARGTALVFVLFLWPSVARGVTDSVVIVGAGEVGPWQTTLTFANPSDQPSSFAVSTLPDGPTPCYFPVCPFWNLSLPSHGSETVSFPAFPSADFPLNTIFVTPAEGSMLPIVTARISNSANACQSEPLPVILLSSLRSSAGQALIFTGVTRGNGGHSNLAIGGVGPDGISESIRVRAQLFAADGTPIGETVFSNVSSNGGNVPASAPILILDVAGQFGVDSIQGGQLAVSLMAGDAALWGALATITVDGALVITPGRNP